MQFGTETGAFHVLLELYASGNIILTDFEYNILTLLRTHKYDEDTKCAVKEKYPFTHAANGTLDSIITDGTKIQEIIKKSLEVVPAEEGKKKKKGKKGQGQGNALKCLNEMVPYISAPLADHVLQEQGISSEDIIQPSDFEKLASAAN